MKQTRTIILIAAMIIIIPSFGFAQFLKVGAGGGITQILGPESLTNDVDNGAGFSTEWNIGLVGKLDLPLIPITPRGFIFYHSLSGSGDFREGTADVTQSIFEVGLGVQYNFVPVPAGVDPYISLDLSSTSFSNLKMETHGVEPFPVPLEYQNEIPSEKTRVGVSLGLGTEVSMLPMVNVDLSLNYKAFNLIGKDDGEKTVSAVTLDALIVFGLL